MGRYNTNGLRYRATVSHKGRGINAGTFDSPEVAAFSYDLLQLELKKEATLLKRLNFKDFWIGRINENRQKAGIEEKEKSNRHRCIRDYLKVCRDVSFQMSAVFDFSNEAKVQVEGKTKENSQFGGAHLQPQNSLYKLGTSISNESCYALTVPPTVAEFGFTQYIKQQHQHQPLNAFSLPPMVSIPQFPTLTAPRPSNIDFLPIEVLEECLLWDNFTSR